MLFLKGGVALLLLLGILLQLGSSDLVDLICGRRAGAPTQSVCLKEEDAVIIADCLKESQCDCAKCVVPWRLGRSLVDDGDRVFVDLLDNLLLSIVRNSSNCHCEEETDGTVVSLSCRPAPPAVPDATMAAVSACLDKTWCNITECLGSFMEEVESGPPLGHPLMILACDHPTCRCTELDGGDVAWLAVNQDDALMSDVLECVGNSRCHNPDKCLQFARQTTTLHPNHPLVLAICYHPECWCREKDGKFFVDSIREPPAFWLEEGASVETFVVMDLLAERAGGSTDPLAVIGGPGIIRNLVAAYVRSPIERLDWESSDSAHIHHQDVSRTRFSQRTPVSAGEASDPPPAGPEHHHQFVFEDTRDVDAALAPDAGAAFRRTRDVKVVAQTQEQMRASSEMVLQNEDTEKPNEPSLHEEKERNETQNKESSDSAQIYHQDSSRKRFSRRTLKSFGEASDLPLAGVHPYVFEDTRDVDAALAPGAGAAFRRTRDVKLAAQTPEQMREKDTEKPKAEESQEAQDKAFYGLLTTTVTSFANMTINLTSSVTNMVNSTNFVIIVLITLIFGVFMYCFGKRLRAFCLKIRGVEVLAAASAPRRGNRRSRRA